MSCWVVPAIAAEFWGMPLDLIMQQIALGQLPTKLEQGFTFIDVAPDSPVYEPARPQTFTVMSDQQLGALSSDESTPPKKSNIPDLKDEDDTLPLNEEPPAPKSTQNYRTARKETGRLRIPPMQAAA